MAEPAETTLAGGAKNSRHHILLTNRQSAGDILMLTAAVRDLRLAHPDVAVSVQTSCPELWAHNPHITPWTGRGREVPATYDLAWRATTNRNEAVHFTEGFTRQLERQLGLSIPVTVKAGDLHLSEAEKAHRPAGVPEHYWLLAAGGKFDFTTKWPDPNALQAVVDHFAGKADGKIAFVQVGETRWSDRYNPLLGGVVDLVGKTSLRELVRLVAHADGVLCPITFVAHAAACFGKPCVVIAGGREAPTFIEYPHQRTLHTLGELPCCQKPCWKNRCQTIGDGDKMDSESLCVAPVQVRPGLDIAECIVRVGKDRIIEAIGSFDPAVPEAPIAPVKSVDKYFTHIGLLVSTYGAAPYIRMQVDSWNRLGRQTVKGLNRPVPMCIVDDCSLDGKRLTDALLNSGLLGTTFYQTANRRGRSRGDLFAFAKALQWAREDGIDILVKFARRFIPLKPWTDDLLSVIAATPAGTWSTRWDKYNFGFQSSAFAVRVADWIEYVPEILLAAEAEKEPFVEMFLHNIARKVAKKYPPHGQAHPCDGYEVWPFLNDLKPSPNFLWHSTAAPAMYFEKAKEWGMGDLKAEDFTVKD